VWKEETVKRKGYWHSSQRNNAAPAQKKRGDHRGREGVLNNQFAQAYDKQTPASEHKSEQSESLSTQKTTRGRE